MIKLMPIQVGALCGAVPFAIYDVVAKSWGDLLALAIVTFVLTFIVLPLFEQRGSHGL